MQGYSPKELLEFIERSPTCFHVVNTLEGILHAGGFEKLQESHRWTLRPGGKYYVTRNGSSIIAFCVPKVIEGFHIMASHSDSPTFKLKELPEINVEKKYTKLNVEGYGGMLMSTWFDRPLSAAGRLLVRDGERIVSKLVNVDRDLLLIPSLAIHMNRGVNEGYKFNIQKDLLSLYGDGNASGTFMDVIAETAGVDVQHIMGHDLFLYPRVRGSIWGEDGCYISSARLDDLQCVFASANGLLRAESCPKVAMMAVLDNEEVGSTTKQGAASDFLKETVFRICRESGMDELERSRVMASSFMVSADNAQAAHPNHMEKSDAVNRPFMNEGIVIKYNANQRYTSDGVSSAIFKMICEKAGVPYQVYVNRSDIAGGSTLGNIAGTQISMNTVDIGLAQLAMHSSYETAGAKDTEYLVKAAKQFFESNIQCAEDGYTLSREA